LLIMFIKRFSIIFSFSSQNILYEELRLRRHKQQHRFALLHPGAAYRLTATPETTAALLKDILDAFPDAHSGLQFIKYKIRKLIYKSIIINI
jgi:hypothetical protein